MIKQFKKEWAGDKEFRAIVKWYVTILLIILSVIISIGSHFIKIGWLK